jgi:hypothetical protein
MPIEYVILGTLAVIQVLSPSIGACIFGYFGGNLGTFANIGAVILGSSPVPTVT